MKLCRIRHSADDFIVTASDKETLEDIKRMIEDFLKPRRPTLSKEKTVITHIDEGFDFLRWIFRKFKGKLIIMPSHKSMCKITQKVSELIKNSQTIKQEILISREMRLSGDGRITITLPGLRNPFSTIDHRIWKMLWRWAKRRHPNKGKQWIVNKYRKTHKGRKWTYMTEKNILFLMMDMPIV